MCEELRKAFAHCWAGIFGALVSLYYTKPLCIYKGVVSFLGGSVSAIVISPAIAKHAGDHLLSAIAFIVGVFSMSIIGIVFQVFDRIKASPVSTIGEFVDIIIDVLLAFRHGKHRPKRGLPEDNE